VLEAGEVWAGDPVSVENRPVHGVTIAQAFRAFLTEPQLLPELVEIDGLPDDLRETHAERLPLSDTTTTQLGSVVPASSVSRRSRKRRSAPSSVSCLARR